MSGPARHRGRLMRGLRSLLAAAALVGMAAIGAGVTYGTFTSSAQNPGNSFASGSVALADNDGNTAMLALSGVRPGDPANVGCIQLTSTGSLVSEVRHYATLGGSATLRSNLQLKVTRGSDINPGFDSCSNFTADSCDYTGNGAGVIYSGTLAGLPTSYATGIVDPAGCSAYPDAVAGSGAKSHWRLGESSGTTSVDARGTNHGTIVGSPTLGTAGALAGNGAFTFDGVDDYVRTARQVADDFTLELWFRTTQGVGTSTNWYDGAGLVDAEETGVTNDFGISINATGRVLAGVGNPDVTLQSAAGLNNGAWHHVAFTRVRSSGAIRLYVDGDLVASSTASTNALAAQTDLDFGRIQTGNNYFAGALDEVAVYERALTPEEVADHSGARGDGSPTGVAEQWRTSERHSYRYEISLPSGTPSTVQGLSADTTLRWEARNR